MKLYDSNPLGTWYKVYIKFKIQTKLSKRSRTFTRKWN